VHLEEHGFTRLHQESERRIQFTTDERYQDFPARSVEAEVLGIRVKIACVEDVTQGKQGAHNVRRITN
jgi:hypothetical protein